MSVIHALLSPSGVHRWAVCTPSARLTEHIQSSSVYAEEGTCAHDLAELLLKDKLGLIKPGDYAAQLIAIQRNEHYTKAMFEHCSDYADIVCEKFNNYKSQGYEPTILIETKVDYSSYVREGYGYLDCAIYTAQHICVIDFKYGVGIPVKADNNPQLKLYALGVLDSLAFTHNIKEIYLSVYQPRAGGLSNWMLTADELSKWAFEVIKPAAVMAWNGEGEFVAGDHCHFCGIKGQCRARAELNLQTAQRAFTDPVLLEDEEITDLLGKFDSFETWMKAVQQFALQSALTGKKWPGYKLVAGQSKRVYKSEEEVKKHLLAQDFQESAITTKSLLNITEMQAFLGKALFTKLLGPLVIKPKGKPTLVPESDERPAYSTAAKAAEVFSDGLETEQEDFG